LAKNKNKKQERTKKYLKKNNKKSDDEIEEDEEKYDNNDDDDGNEFDEDEDEKPINVKNYEKNSKKRRLASSLMNCNNDVIIFSLRIAIQFIIAHEFLANVRTTVFSAASKLFSAS
jgi:hypothetical protein